MRKLKTYFPFACLFIFLLSACSSTSVTKKSQYFKLKKVWAPLEELQIYQYKHKNNGLEVFLVPGHAKNAVAYVTAFDVGSRDEEKGKTGLAHLFEHMMFRGTESFPEPFKTLASWGAQYNATTSQDQTTYYQLVPSSVFPQLVKFEAERMRKLMITPELLNTERGAVVSERKSSTEDSPMGRLFWELFTTAFDKHTYKILPIGYQEDIDRASFDEVLEFYKQHYNPSNASIAVVGDFQVNEALKLLDQNYGTYKSHKVKKITPLKEPLKRKMRRKVVRLKTQNALMADAVFSPSNLDPQVPEELFLCILLADNDIGYLRYALVEKGIAQNVFSSCYPNKDPNLAVIVLEGRTGVPLKRLEQEYTNALRGFAEWATEDRIEKIKLYFSAGKWSSLRSPLSLAKQIASMSKLSGNPLYGFDLTDKILKVNRAQIIERLASWKERGKTRILIEPAQKNDPFGVSR